MKTLTHIIVILFILLIIGFVHVGVMNSKETEIKKCAIENKYEIKSIDNQLTIFGSTFNYLNKGQFNLLCVYDDRLQVLDMWYDQNIFTFNVNQGNFEF